MRDDYSGPAVWHKKSHNLADRFMERRMEWAFAVATLIWGCVCLFSNGKFLEAPVFSEFNRIFYYPAVVGFLLALAGIARLIGLGVNGSREEITPTIRVWSAYLSGMIWVGLSYCFWQSGVISPWLAIYPVFAVGEYTNILAASVDEGKYKHGRLARISTETSP